jgi:sortase A
MNPRRSTRTWLATERLAWAAGVVGLVVWSIAGVYGAVSARDAIEQFAGPDQRLWSPERVRAWRDTQTDEAPTPLAVLRIPRLGVEAPVLEGTSEWTLNRGVGLIEDTARPGADGNSGIAGHRDGFFRGLKDVRVGDVLALETRDGITAYRARRCLRARHDPCAVGHAGDLLPVLLRRTCAPAVHRPRIPYGDRHGRQ